MNDNQYILTCIFGVEEERIFQIVRQVYNVIHLCWPCRSDISITEDDVAVGFTTCCRTHFQRKQTLVDFLLATILHEFVTNKI